MSKIANEICDALTRPVGDGPWYIPDIIDSVIGDRRISRKEVEQLRADAAYANSLKTTLELAHVNLARAENEAATYKVTSEINAANAKRNDGNAKDWFQFAMHGLDIVAELSVKTVKLEAKLWNTEKELNDLKKSLDVPPTQAAELQWNGLPYTWTATQPLQVGETVILNGKPCKILGAKSYSDPFAENPEPKKSYRGLIWVGVILALAAIASVTAYYDSLRTLAR